MTSRSMVTVGALFAGLAVAAGAFGAHGLRAVLSPADLTTFETAARYQMYHGLALIAAAWVAERWPSRLPQVAAWCFIAGILLFSGSLYALVLSGVRILGAITPIGGVAFLVGWGCLAMAPRRDDVKT